MSFELPQLPYAMDALEPHISKETLEFHYGKHHKTYVDKLNGLVPGSEYEGKSLEDIIKSAPAGGVFNNAAQVWNHTFYWNCLSPNGGGEPTGAIADAIKSKWGSFEEFQKEFNDKAVNNFGSSWTWLVKNDDFSLEIVNTSNAGNPMTSGQRPVMTCDLWEHAYYIDYRNVRPNYLGGFWSLVNWDFINESFAV
ncbi:Fe-Mn family superoxide dismutase [Neptunomonas phycophila]|jgi:Fe-Mn family superoxide dismutase|uniref:Superoxide dismutase n=2 Tax=Neptunomonas phycophila TaxID=1572645 RepID=A0AAW7XF55_9GAMM|nr:MULTISPECIES: Fe-Mn family superoxide dismutase [Neptunomonas]MBT3145539.1 superoxide dismutase [Fe] [Neptunomonas phycophila]MDN2660024.1 superoxide dismutase [Fe] [Neptunomonas sp. CHC150]MDO6453056.1 Fe-Mn family superoxide dismutase [Neptunomonas phycophila]MDO6469157.1 Fe-Mn family superoxide dismutase [Neptunomonas phycophila]MDO6784510.1 Fe-Mn family superoxide dismutase [Neptunomonas phycophila]